LSVIQPESQQLWQLQTNSSSSFAVNLTKCFFGLVDLCFNDYFVLTVDSTTRGHKYKLFTKYSRLNIWKHFFTERVVSV